MDVFRREFFSSPDVVDVIRVATINENIPWLEQLHQVSDGFIDDRRRHHQPERPRLRKFLNEIGQRGGANRFLLDQLLYRLRRYVEDYTVVPRLYKASHHIGAHYFQVRSFRVALQGSFLVRVIAL